MRDAHGCYPYAIACFRSVGGIRVSVFNAMSVEAIAPFLQFAKEFQNEHQK